VLGTCRPHTQTADIHKEEGPVNVNAWHPHVRLGEKLAG